MVQWCWKRPSAHTESSLMVIPSLAFTRASLVSWMPLDRALMAFVKSVPPPAIAPPPPPPPPCSVICSTGRWQVAALATGYSTRSQGGRDYIFRSMLVLFRP